MTGTTKLEATPLADDWLVVSSGSSSTVPS